MKKIVLFILLLSASIIANAQDTVKGLPQKAEKSPHMTFKGIPIDNKIDSFSTELAVQGYRPAERERIKIVLYGEFLSVADCSITVFGTDKSQIAWKVQILYPEQSFWKTLKEKYFELKEQFNSKYGAGTSSETFLKPYKDGDRSEMQGVLFNKCRYSTIWKTENGNVTLKITVNAQISIEYTDSLNSSLAQKEKKEMVNDI